MKTEKEDSGQENSKEEKVNVKKEVIGWIRTLAIVVIAVFVVTNFVIINAQIPSGSMEKTIMTGDRLIGFRFSYWFSEPKRGDIILFKYPVDEDQTYIKRVIGESGDTVKIEDGKIYINGSKTPLKENYLPEDWYVENDGYTYHVPKNCYLVLGDNRNYSADARYWPEEAIKADKADTEKEAEKYSYVTRKEVLGKAIFRYYRGFKWLVHTADYQK